MTPSCSSEEKESSPAHSCIHWHFATVSPSRENSGTQYQQNQADDAQIPAGPAANTHLVKRSCVQLLTLSWLAILKKLRQSAATNITKDTDTYLTDQHKHVTNYSCINFKRRNTVLLSHSVDSDGRLSGRWLSAIVDGQLTRQFSLSHKKTRMTLSRWHITRAKQFPIIQSSMLSNQIITGLFKICQFWIFILIYIKLYPLIDCHLNTPDLSRPLSSFFLEIHSLVSV